jgi:serine/threonine protein kinase
MPAILPPGRSARAPLLALEFKFFRPRNVTTIASLSRGLGRSKRRACPFSGDLTENRLGGRMIGQNVGNYRIIRLLGEGGMGTVYLAEHPGLGRQSAVKILRKELANNEQMIQRFFNEARAANAVGHPGIVEIWDFGTLPSGEPYLMMELLRGRSLSGRMRRAGRIPVANALDIADQAAGALGAAHDKGIVHRDLKPDNIFLVADPHRPGRELVKILDFGIAKLAPAPESSRKAVTRTGAVLGTPLYMSPEQCRATKEVDHRSDIYSLGIIVYEMLAGVPPFSSDSSGELVHMHIGVEPPPLRTRNPDLVEELEQVVGRMLAKDPAARFQSMAEVQAALTGGAPRTVVLSEGTDPGRPLTPPVRRTTFAEAASEVHDGPTLRRRPRWALAGGVAAAAGLAAALAIGFDREPPLAPTPAALEPPPIMAPAPAAIIAPPKPRLIDVDIVTTPAGARVVREKDGAELAVTPARLSWPEGEGIELLRLERDGYRPEKVVVPLDRGVKLELALERLVVPRPAHATPAPRRHAAPAATPAPAPVTRPTPAKKPPEPLKI